MLVGHRGTDDPDVAAIAQGLPDRLAGAVTGRLGVQYAFLPSSRRLRSHPWVGGAGVLQLGNLHGGYFAYTALPRLAGGRPVVWTLHDMWAFTGHCGYSLGHDGWLTGCGNCPHLDSYPPLRRDATRRNWRLKGRVYHRLDLTVVTPSAWLGSLARRSPLLAAADVRVIPYGIDTEVFSPVPQEAARRELGLPAGDPVVLVVGLERRKGSELLPRILAAAGRPLTLLVAGKGSAPPLPEGVTARQLGLVEDDRTMRLAYAASDAFLLPTQADNLPNTAIESLACGTPVVASDVGGVPEIVEDGRTGLLRPLDAGALGNALAGLLADPELGRRLGGAGREVALERFGLELQARRYLELYEGK